MACFRHKIVSSANQAFEILHVSFNIYVAKLFVSRRKQKVSLGKQVVSTRRTMLKYLRGRFLRHENRGVLEQNR